MMQTTSLATRIHSLKPATFVSNEDHDLMSMNRQIMKRRTLHICIGKALMKTPLFQADGLTLYCGVPVRHLLPENTPAWNEFFDFVVCRGKEAVIALRLTDMDPLVYNRLWQGFQTKFPPGFTQLFQSKSFYGDWDWFAEDVVVPTIAPAFQTGDFRMKSPLLPVPSKLLKKLANPCGRVLIKELSPYEKGRQWVPTEYGGSLGLFLGFRTDKNNRVRPLICCARDAIDGLQEAASWGEPDSPPPELRPNTLSQRVDMAKRGMTAHAGVMMDMVRQLAEMPLQDYFRNDPNGLKEIRNMFPEAHTYQEAANSLDTFTGNANVSNLLLEILVNPLIDRTDIPLTGKPVRSVLLGASLLAKSKYLTWSGEVLFYDHNKSGSLENKPYREWIRKAVYCINKEKGNIDNFYNVLYLLTVQPFSMVYQQTAKLDI